MPRYLRKICLCAAALILANSSAGCAGLIVRKGRAGEAATRSFRGPDCQRTYGKQPLLREQWGLQMAWVGERQRAAEQIAAIVCADRLDPSAINGPSVTLERMISALHFSFDDRRFDHLAAARMLSLCVAPKTVNGGSATFCEANPIGLGMLQWYAERLDAGQLAAAVRSVDLAPDTQAAFVSKAMAARAQVLEQGAKLDPRRRAMYVDVPNSVREERHQYFQKHEALYRRLDAVQQKARVAAAGSKQPELVKALTALRGEYFSRCKDASCKLDPFVTEVSRELVLLHVLAQDAVAAELEFGLISEEHANIRGYGPTIWLAQRRAMEAEVKKFHGHERASKSGADTRILEATYGVPPPDQGDPRGVVASFAAVRRRGGGDVDVRQAPRAHRVHRQGRVDQEEG